MSEPDSQLSRITEAKVSPHHNIVYYLRYRESFRESIGLPTPFGYDPVDLAGVYVVSHLPEYRDPGMIKRIDEMLKTKGNPVTDRFVLAGTILSRIWDEYITWGRRELYDNDKSARQELARKTRNWLVTGTEQNKFDVRYQNAVITIGNRINIGGQYSDTFITSIEDKRRLEKALGSKIGIRNVPDIEETLQSIRADADNFLKITENRNEEVE